METLLPVSKPAGITASQLSIGFGQPPGRVYIAPIQFSLSCVLPVYLFSLDSVPALLVPKMLWRCREINMGPGDSGTPWEGSREPGGGCQILPKFLFEKACL